MMKHLIIVVDIKMMGSVALFKKITGFFCGFCLEALVF